MSHDDLPDGLRDAATVVLGDEGRRGRHRSRTSGRRSPRQRADGRDGCRAARIASPTPARSWVGTRAGRSEGATAPPRAAACPGDRHRRAAVRPTRVTDLPGPLAPAAWPTPWWSGRPHGAQVQTAVPRMVGVEGTAIAPSPRARRHVRAIAAHVATALPPGADRAPCRNVRVDRPVSIFQTRDRAVVDLATASWHRVAGYPGAPMRYGRPSASPRRPNPRRRPPRRPVRR
jgi:hypothetical protein